MKEHTLGSILWNIVELVLLLIATPFILIFMGLRAVGQWLFSFLSPSEDTVPAMPTKSLPSAREPSLPLTTPEKPQKKSAALHRDKASLMSIKTEEAELPERLDVPGDGHCGLYSVLRHVSRLLASPEYNADYQEELLASSWFAQCTDAVAALDVSCKAFSKEDWIRKFRAMDLGRTPLEKISYQDRSYLYTWCRAMRLTLGSTIFAINKGHTALSPEYLPGVMHWNSKIVDAVSPEKRSFLLKPTKASYPSPFEQNMDIYIVRDEAKIPVTPSKFCETFEIDLLTSLHIAHDYLAKNGAQKTFKDEASWIRAFCQDPLFTRLFTPLSSKPLEHCSLKEKERLFHKHRSHFMMYWQDSENRVVARESAFSCPGAQESNMQETFGYSPYALMTKAQRFLDANPDKCFESEASFVEAFLQSESYEDLLQGVLSKDRATFLNDTDVRVFCLLFGFDKHPASAFAATGPSELAQESFAQACTTESVQKRPQAFIRLGGEHFNHFQYYPKHSTVVEPKDGFSPQP